MASCAVHRGQWRISVWLHVLILLTGSAAARGDAVEAVSDGTGTACLLLLGSRHRGPWTEAVAKVNRGVKPCEGSPLADGVDAAGKWLYGSRYQTIIAAVALCVGLISAWDAAVVLRVLVPAGAAVAAMSIAHREAMLWDFAPTLASEGVFLLQAGAAAVVATHVGFEGAQVLCGVASGWAAAYCLGDWARDLDPHAPGVEFLWYQVGAVFGFLASTAWRPEALAVLAPLLGGLCAVTGFGVLTSKILTSFKQGLWALEMLPPASATWADTAVELLGPAAPLQIWACAAAVMALQRVLRLTWATAVCLTVGLALATLPKHTGLACLAGHTFASGCPAWLRPAVLWHWPVLGSLLWIAFTAFAAWQQLARLPQWEDRHFWHRQSPMPAAFAKGLPWFSGQRSEAQQEAQPEDVPWLDPALETERASSFRLLPSPEELAEYGPLHPKGGVLGIGDDLENFEMELRDRWRSSRRWALEHLPLGNEMCCVPSNRPPLRARGNTL